MYDPDTPHARQAQLERLLQLVTEMFALEDGRKPLRPDTVEAAYKSRQKARKLVTDLNQDQARLFP